MSADPTEGLLTSYKWVDGRRCCVNRQEYRLLGARVAALHRLRGFTRTRSSFRRVFADGHRARHAERAEVRNAAMRLCAVEPSVRSSVFDNRSAATHGDLRTANVVVGSHGLTLIDWDRFSSVSPEFDVCLPLFDACCQRDGMAAAAAFAAAYTEAGGELDLALLRRSIDLIGDLYLVHGWLRASSVPELPGRRRHFRDWVLPRSRRWDRDRSTYFDMWKEHLQ